MSRRNLKLRIFRAGVLDTGAVFCYRESRREGQNMTFGEKLQMLRARRGLSQDALAEALEVSRQTIGSLENGRYNPSILLAFKLARYFGTTIEDIFIYEEDGT